MDLITIILLSLLLIMTLLYLFYSRLAILAGITLKLIFPLLVIIILSCIFLPQAYVGIANFTLKDTPFAQQLRSLDEILAKPVEIREGFLDEFNKLIGRDSEQNQGDEPAQVSNLYADFINASASLLRLFTLVISFLGLITVVYLRYSLISVSDSAKLRSEVTLLTARINVLEQKFN